MRKILAVVAVLVLACGMAWGQSASRDFVDTESDYIESASTWFADDDTTYSFAAWVRFGTDQFQYVASQGYTLDTNLLFYIGSATANFNLIAGTRYQSSTYTCGTRDTTNTLTTGTWYWVVYRRVGSSPSVEACNTRLLGTNTTASFANSPPGTIPTNKGTLAARFYNSATPTTFGDINLAYVHLYDRVLSDQEADSLQYCPGSITNGLVGYYPLTDGGSTLYDHSNSSNDGTNNGTAVSTLGPPVSFCGGPL